MIELHRKKLEKYALWLLEKSKTESSLHIFTPHHSPLQKYLSERGRLQMHRLICIFVVHTLHIIRFVARLLTDNRNSLNILFIHTNLFLNLFIMSDISGEVHTLMEFQRSEAYM